MYGICRIAVFLFLLAARATDSRPVDLDEPEDFHAAAAEFEADAHALQERHRRTPELTLGELAQVSGVLNVGHVPLQDCKALKNEQSLTSGLYKIYPGDKEGEFTTFCDMQLSGDGEGWTVIQRRVDGGTLFNRTWAEYENGFGDLNENFWLGLRKIQRITDMGTHELFIGLEDKLHRTAHAVYRDFNLGSPHYKLIVGAYDESRSTAQDSLKEHNMQPFSTIDIDHDAATNAHCAHQHQGGWWYHSCVHSNLNGVYHAGGSASGKNDGIVWKDWLGDFNVAISTIMAVRRVS